jgi:dihydropteroate synthase
VDPGFGFGKTLAHNLSLLRHLRRFTDLAAGILVGISRKSMIGAVLDAPVGERLSGSLAAAVIAAWQGAHIIRSPRCPGDGASLAGCAAAAAVDGLRAEQRHTERSVL